MPLVHPRQAEIARALGVVAPFADVLAVDAEIARRIAFIRQCLHDASLQVLVLGISGGVDSLVAGRLAQLAVQDLRASTNDPGYRLVAMRLPHGLQRDEEDAAAAMRFVAADVELTVDIAPAVAALRAQLGLLESLRAAERDFVLGNVKARVRMVAQYAVANARSGLVVGTDHAAEAVMGFFTKFGDGACDLTPLAGLVKGQVRAIARRLGAPDFLVDKVPTADLEELDPGKADEAAYGIGYDEIDAFLHGRPVSAEAQSIIVRRYDQTAHKRREALKPVG
jgi:NAD+ synthase